MNRKVFNQHIAESNFKELFISEMGWNNPHGQTEFELELDEVLYTFRIIAERNGFQVLACEVSDIPTASLCKKMDTRLRRSANDYICIFYGANCVSQSGKSIHHLWAVPVRKVEKRDIVLVEYTSADAAGFLYEKMEGLSFRLDEQTTITDVVAKVQSAFIINSERITKDFYTGFKKEHTKFAQFISGIDDHIVEKENRNKQWYTSVMLNRLMFCYFIQKKGFLDGDVDYLQHKLEWHKEQTASRSLTQNPPSFFQSFYKGFLRTLFHGGLNAPKHDGEFENIYGRIPYLNGGMFDVHQLEQDYKDLDIADDAFISLFDFFDRWHWHLDDRITATGRDINPDVLGYIFEQYINDRAQMGAYYTKEDITEYIGRNTILPYLVANCVSQLEEHTARTQCATIWQFLQQSGDRYIFDAVKKGAGLEIPEEIAIGLDTTKPNLLERRKRWNDRTPERFALPTEIWRETIERLQRYENVKEKIENGEIRNINDFITYNLDIRSFVYDLLNTTDDPRLIKRFYAELQKITILDPTCGSGAFLFAALNILEPLYEVCITRMQEFQQQNPDLFGVELDEIKHQYRSNIQYFIYKSIILRNLYGVDIMVEATEIAKLRLFLKMVAVVDVDKRDPNLGLDPLPDIDFNIRCGNTLVGYATEKALEDDLDYGDPFAAAELRPLIQEKMGEVAEAYRKFKGLQLIQTEEPDAFKRVKGWLKEHLSELNDLLNRKLYQSTTSEEKMTYEQWLCSHQPFHWLAEFYEIINDHGGFDVIIGNPPYLESSQINYTVQNYITSSSNAVHAYCIERSIAISKGYLSMIVPLAIVCTKRFPPVQKMLSQSNNVWYANFAWRPARLFDAVNRDLTIFVTYPSDNKPSVVFTTGYTKWITEHRNLLMSKICYTHFNEKQISYWIPKLCSNIEIGILLKVRKHSSCVLMSNNPALKSKVYYRNTGGLYWKVFTDFAPKFTCNGIQRKSSCESSFYVDNSITAKIIVGLLSSNLFWWWYTITSDLRHVTSNEICGLRIPKTVFSDDKLIKLGTRYIEDLVANSTMLTREQKSQGTTVTQSFKIVKSKLIIDEIDKVLAVHYGFTEEELDFIINYDIKYRMGEELES